MRQTKKKEVKLPLGWAKPIPPQPICTFGSGKLKKRKVHSTQIDPN
jgi:hypothetical protein